MGGGERPQWAVYDETEQFYRDRPTENFSFYPVGINAQKQGRLVCFRRVADLPLEAGAQGARMGAPIASPAAPVWTAVIWKDRKCPTWSRYEPGVAPREQFAEERARRFTLDLKSIESRLTWTAIWVAIIIGLMQLSLMTPDSFGWRLVKKVVHCVAPQAPPKTPPSAAPRATDGGAEGIPRTR